MTIVTRLGTLSYNKLDFGNIFNYEEGITKVPVELTYNKYRELVSVRVDGLVCIDLLSRAEEEEEFNERENI